MDLVTINIINRRPTATINIINKRPTVTINVLKKELMPVTKAAVDSAIGVSLLGSATKFYNEQGYFVSITIPEVPTQLSQLSDDSTHRLVTDTEKGTWNGKQDALSGIVTGHYHAEIKDTAGTTYVDTDEVSNIVKIKSANTGTNDILQLFEGTGTPVKAFHVDGNGTLKYNAVNYFYRPGTENLFIDTKNTHASITSANTNIALGKDALSGLTSGSTSIGIGYFAGKQITQASDNICIGYYSGYSLTTQGNNIIIGRQAQFSQNRANNIAIGQYCLNANTGAGTIGIGHNAGRYNDTVNMLYIDQLDRTNTAGGKSKSLITGLFSANVVDQWVQINGVIKSYGRRQNLVTKTADYTATNSDEVIIVDGSGTGVDITLPTISATNHGQTYTIKAIDITNTCTIIRGGTNTFEDASTTLTFVSQWQVIKLIADNDAGIWRML